MSIPSQRSLSKAATLAVLSLAWCVTAPAQVTYDIANSGGWETETTWAPASPPGGPTVLDDLDIVNIDGGRTVTIPGVYTISSLTYDETDTVVFNANAGSPKNFTITGDLTKNGTGLLQFTSGGGAYTTVAVGGNLAVNNGRLLVTNNRSITVGGGTTVAGGAILELRHHNPSTFGATTLDGIFRQSVIFHFTPSLQFDGLNGASSGILEVNTDANSARVTDLRFAPAGGTYTYAGSITEGPVNHRYRIAKIDTGTQVLSGTTFHTGGTAVNAGTLRFSGTHTGGGAYTVSSGATLDISGGSVSASSVNVNASGTVSLQNGGKLILTGAGTFNSGITVENGSTLQVEDGGSTTGAVTVNGNLSAGAAGGIASASLDELILGSSSTTRYSLDPEQYGNPILQSDRIAVNTLTLNSGLTVEMNVLGASAVTPVQEYVLFEVPGSSVDLTGITFNFVPGLDTVLNSTPTVTLSVGSGTDGADQIILGNFSAMVVPEPSTLVLLGLGLGLLTWRCLQKRQ